jgi:hypothetical protein
VSKRSLNIVPQVSIRRTMPENWHVFSRLLYLRNDLALWKNERAVFKRQSGTASRIFSDHLPYTTKNPAIAGFFGFLDPRLRGDDSP